MEEPVEQDTPVKRANISDIELDKLEAMIADLQQRRLARVKQLEAVAKVKADEHNLTTYLKFTRAVTRMQEKLKKLDDELSKAEESMNKIRAMHMLLE